MKFLRWRLPIARLRNVRPRTWAKVSAIAVLALLWWLCGGGHRDCWPRDEILDAIRFVESGDRDSVPDGDGGKAIGPYQIWHVYWQDAIAAEPSLGGTYQDCRRRDYAERVIAAYMRRWAPEAWRAGDAEWIARVHNGGPRGFENEKTLSYWERVRARLP